MNIDVTDLLTNTNNEILVNNELLVDNELLKKTTIKKLNNVIFKGSITKSSEIYTISGDLTGTMILSDDITLEDVNYDFSIKIDECFSEFDENNENNLKIINNLLDIFPLLWQNILLEVPLKVKGAKNSNIKLQGEDWKLVSEDELSSENNALSELKTLLNKRKE